MNNCKRSGEWAELQFMAKAAKFGLLISKSWGRSARNDMVIETGGRFLRVQIKSTMYLRSEGCYLGEFGPVRRASPTVEENSILWQPMSSRKMSGTSSQRGLWPMGKGLEFFVHVQPDG